MFIAGLFVIIKNQEQSKCSLTGKWKKKSAVYPFNGLLETEKIELINETPQKQYTK